MATILRDWSYQYQWLYDAIARLASVSVGGEARFRQLALEGLPIQPETQVLDLCCGSGQTTQFLVQRSRHVTGLDASPLSIKRAKRNVPAAEYVEAFAEKMPFQKPSSMSCIPVPPCSEMESEQLRQILQEAYRVLKPGGYLALVDFHQPTNPVFVPGLSLFLLLFETETAWALLRTDLAALLTEIGFQIKQHTFHAGGSLQVIQAQK